MTPTVVVATPTRGLVHSRTVEAVDAALRAAEDAGIVERVEGQWWVWTHGLPIPEAHEEVIEKALATGADLVWIVEDDNLPASDALVRSMDTMDETAAGIVAVTYPIGTLGMRWDSIYREEGEILFCALGITLIRREVFERMRRPWFDMTRHYGRVSDGKGGTTLGFVDKPWPPQTGGVDVAFSLKARAAGFSIAQVPRMVGGHMRITREGARSGSGVNDRPHEVEVWNTIDVDQRSIVGTDMDRFDIREQWKEWQNLFRRSRWITRFWLADRAFGGEYDAVHDQRLVLARDRFSDARTVLELGALEGGHTVALSRWAERVVAVEGRPENAQKARLVLQAHRITNAEVVEGNLESMRLADLGKFDLVVAVGVLYHMPEPQKLLARCADAGPNLFLWTHYSRADGPESRSMDPARSPLSGLSPLEVWLPKHELLADLERLYRNVEVLNDEPNHPNGPAITIEARGAR